MTPFSLDRDRPGDERPCLFVALQPDQGPADPQGVGVAMRRSNRSVHCCQDRRFGARITGHHPCHGERAEVHEVALFAGDQCQGRLDFRERSDAFEAVYMKLGGQQEHLGGLAGIHLRDPTRLQPKCSAGSGHISTTHPDVGIEQMQFGVVARSGAAS